jgi:hypothetical protein
LPTDSDNRPIDTYGNPVSTDTYGKPIGADASPLPTDDNGNFILSPSSEEKVDATILPTNEYGRPIYSVVHPDGSLLPTNAYGYQIDDNGTPISTL